MTDIMKQEMVQVGWSSLVPELLGLLLTNSSPFLRLQTGLSAYFEPYPASQSRPADAACSSASPFWRNATPANGPKKTTRESSLVVGAAYSHADMIKFDNL